MFVIVWHYRVKPDRETEFVKEYGPEGSWTSFFASAEGYLGSELYRDTQAARTYLTVDRWTSRQASDSFLTRRSDEYEAIDSGLAGLTEVETCLGRFELVDPGR